MEELNFKAFENGGGGYKSRLLFIRAEVTDFDKSVEELNKLIFACNKTYNAIEKDENCCLYANGFLIAVEDFAKDNFSWWESDKIPMSKTGYDDLGLALSLYRQVNVNRLFSVGAGRVLDEFGKRLYDNYFNLDRLEQSYYWQLLDVANPIAIDILFKVADTGDDSLIDGILSNIDEINRKMNRIKQGMSNMMVLDNYVIRKTAPWVSYYSKPYTNNQIPYGSIGKWMYFFKLGIVPDVTNLCRQAIEGLACDFCEHTNIDETGLPTGVICFYCNGFNIDAHKNILKFMLEHDLISKTDSGKLHNISFKFDHEIGDYEYGDELNGAIKLADFLDLDTGEFYSNEQIRETLDLGLL